MNFPHRRLTVFELKKRHLCRRISYLAAGWTYRRISHLVEWGERIAPLAECIWVLSVDNERTKYKQNCYIVSDYSFLLVGVASFIANRSSYQSVTVRTSQVGNNNRSLTVPETAVKKTPVTTGVKKIALILNKISVRLKLTSVLPRRSLAKRTSWSTIWATKVCRRSNNFYTHNPYTVS